MSQGLGGGVVGFSPAVHGLKFANRWRPITAAHGGLCGGMVFTVMDYWAAGVLPPPRTEAPASVTDPLFTHLRRRQWDSVDVSGGGRRIVAYSLPLYPERRPRWTALTGVVPGLRDLTYQQEWPRVRTALDAGRLCPLTVIRTRRGDLRVNHQVLAYGYRQRAASVDLALYDPNHPMRVVTYHFHLDDDSVSLAQNPDGRPISAFFCTGNYRPRPVPDA